MFCLKADLPFVGQSFFFASFPFSIFVTRIIDLFGIMDLSQVSFAQHRLGDNYVLPFLSSCE
jgi:hypothetical protein